MTAPSGRSFWTPEFWKSYCESDDPYRQYKRERDRKLAVELLDPKPGQRVLEAGCGYGRISEALLGRPGVCLVGMDQSLDMLKVCLRELKGPFSPCRADAGRLPFRAGAFDAVLCSGVLMHLRDPGTALRELCRVLRPGGRLVVSANNLLSPFAIPVWTWIRIRARSYQAFQTPLFYKRNFRRLGIELQRVVGDTLLAVAIQVPGAGRPVLPAALFPALRALDRWVDQAPLSHMAYEVWFQGVKR